MSVDGPATRGRLIFDCLRSWLWIHAPRVYAGRASVVAVPAPEHREIDVMAMSRGRRMVATTPLVADMTREENCRRVGETAVRRFDGLHILVNNAGRAMKYVSEASLYD
jgi:NAD(P)-dependent dehydrogenase (short-subunit alcohol dehydrogenase family)